MVLELSAPFAEDLAALEQLTRSQAAPSVVVVADDVGSDVARQLLKLNVSDWLPRSFTHDEIVLAANQAVAARDTTAERDQHALSVAFMPVLGGMQNTIFGIQTH